jgi:diketogulonate reductase-like aldo/keto reductase
MSWVEPGVLQVWLADQDEPAVGTLEGIGMYLQQLKPPGPSSSNSTLVDLLRTIGEGKHATPAQIALAWLLAQSCGSSQSPHPPSRRLDENNAATGLTLTSDDLHDVATAAAHIEIQGALYRDHLERLTGR